MGYLKNILKAGAIMTAVGLLLALSAPLIATAIGPEILGAEVFKHAVATSIPWTGAFFGAFGAIHAAITPLFDKMFGASQPLSKAASASSQTQAFSLAQEPELEQTHFREAEAQRRAAAVSSSASLQM